MPSWHLADAAELAARHPYTFYKSPPEAIAQVRPGDVVKLIFAFHSDDPQAPGAERMWILLDAPAGSAFAFDHATQGYVAVDA
ncbi:hypothetical protein [Janthinobacterium sp. HLX7-2]|uniref:hypothetical protein n=1 Tax=Janthinobacterium sp. HLX7-2 TaxID=1259331 RepID=UPI003F2181BD